MITRCVSRGRRGCSNPTINDNKKGRQDGQDGQDGQDVILRSRRLPGSIQPYSSSLLVCFSCLVFLWMLGFEAPRSLILTILPEVVVVDRLLFRRVRCDGLRRHIVSSRPIFHVRITHTIPRRALFRLRLVAERRSRVRERSGRSVPSAGSG